MFAVLPCYTTLKKKKKGKTLHFQKYFRVFVCFLYYLSTNVALQ